eukprot:TRINITY_DN827_c0_g1_i1.p1 TRINITY_DN827_c0_g1~~TRINITY_DN827_c0_g1_i1.p1  ORF type:complete len:333 (+),score=66.09 TRINITY_DN827_c0_g1_i1:53-1000(+)
MVANSGVVEVFSYITTVLMIISIICATATIFTFVIHPKIRTYPIKLIMYLCVCIIIGFCAFLVAFEPWVYHDNPGPCIIIAIFVHYFFIANFLWTFCVAFNFYQMIVRRNREAKLLEKWYHLGCWGIPIILCAISGGVGAYGDVGGVCYITDPLVRFLCFFIPGLIIISCNAILFFFIGREIHETLGQAHTARDDRRDMIKELRVYVSIFVSIGLSWIFGYLMFLLPFPIVTDIFFILFSLTAPTQGFLIYVFYCINKKVLKNYLNCFGKVCPICKTFEEKITSNTTNSSSNSRGSSSSNSNSSRSYVDSSSTTL